MSLSSKSFTPALALMPALLSAQTEPLPNSPSPREVVGMDPYVVTSTRTAIDINDAPGSLTVLSREQFSLRPAGRIGDLLRSVPGVYVSSNVLGQGAPSAQAGRFSLRGISGSARTLVLLDNLPLNDPYLGNVNWASLFLDEVQRVEVLPGGGSALYGGNAFAGVVHVITREPESREVFVRGRYQGGGLEQKEGTLLYRDLWSKRLGVSLGYNLVRSEGFDGEMDLVKTSTPGSVPSSVTTGAEASLTTAGLPAWIVGTLATRPWETENAQAKFTYRLDGNSRIKAGVLYFHSDLDFGEAESYLRDVNGQPVYSGTLNIGGDRVVLAERDFLNAPSNDQYIRYFASLEKDFGEQVQLNAGLSYSERDRNASSVGTTATRNGGAGSLTVSPTQTRDVYVQVAGRLGERQHWVSGFNLNRGEMDRSSWTLLDWRDMGSRSSIVDAAEGRTDNASVFLQDEVKLPWASTLFLGGRYDWFETRGVETVYSANGGATRTEFAQQTFGQFSPRAALVIKPWHAATLRASAGRGFRSPSLFDFYVVSRRGTTVTLSNPLLKPESSWNYETGLTQDFNKGSTQVTVTGFANQLEDLIYTKSLSATTRQAINAGEAWSRGAEAKVRQRLCEGLSLQLAYTYTRSEVVSNDADPGSVGKELVNAPRHLVSAVAEGRRGPWSGSLGVLLVDSSFDTAANTDVVHGVYGSFSSYWLLNAQVGYQINQHLEAVAAVENLLDREYFQFTREPGRLFSLGLRATF